MLDVLRGFIEGNEIALGIAVGAVVVATTVWLAVRRLGGPKGREF